MSEFSYSGSELDIFAQATNWKSYVRDQLREYLTGDVLEVGAGIGSNAAVLCDGRQRRWVCLEPDAALATKIPREYETKVGTIADLPERELFDTILYCDVLEHVEDDRGELRMASQHLRPSGALVVLAPAHPWLFNAFDRAVGHYRRYTRSMLRTIRPSGIEIRKTAYLDAAGLLAVGANRLLLRSATPSRTQILFWDRILVSVSRLMDPLTGYRLGKSVLAVWRKPA